MEERKIAIIGAGSSYTPELIDGLLGLEGLTPLRLALYDLPEGRERVEIIHGLAARMAAARRADAAIEIAGSLASALDGCEFVVSQFRAGGLQARIHDETIPLAMGLIGQETTGAGGFFKAMRTIPAALRIAREMEARCPDAWLLNFTNPSGIITEAVLRHARIRCVGLCNVPYNMRVDAARLLGAPVERVDCRMVGLNHLSFVTDIRLDGRPALDRLIQERRFDAQLVKNIPNVPGVAELIARLRMVPSPYLQYFYFEREMLAKQRADLDEGRGTRGEQVLRGQEALFALYRQPALREKPRELESRGGAHYSTVAARLIRALAGLGDVTMPVCCANGGALDGLPPEAVVETDAFIGKRGVYPLAFGRLPESIGGLIGQVKAYESLTVRASTEGSRDLAVTALLNHPLVHGHANAARLVEDLARRYPEHVGALR